MKYIIISEESSYSSMFKVLFNDLCMKKGNVFLDKYFYQKSGFYLFLMRVLYKKEINKYLKSKFEFILRPNFDLIHTINKYNGEQICVIFNNSSVNKYYNEYTLKNIKNKHPNVTFVLYFVDSIFQCKDTNAVKLAKTGIFDLVYTYSKSDAKKYGYLYYPTPYSKLNNSPQNIIKGVYFCGTEKGRTELLKDIAAQCRKLGVTYNFDVEGNPNNSNKYFKIREGNIEKYVDVVKNTISYNCILDLTQKSLDGSKPGLSLRVYEALVYDRVLITNNPLIKEFKYYNPKTMHYIENASDIKKEWIFNKVKNNYHNQFSPLNFAKDIEKRLKL
ncbi:MAG: hypothetical protein LKE67_05615 [Lactobacillus amylovorus]|jgi:disulfide oxidoreductase YuzD|nr:hypothetical protein [Lactobacillus amylovorus]